MTPFLRYKPRPIRLFFICDLHGMRSMGELNYMGKPEYSTIFYCKLCGHIKARILAFENGKLQPFHTREITCGACGGDETIWFYPYWFSVLDDKPIPQELLEYEINAVLQKARLENA